MDTTHAENAGIGIITQNMQHIIGHTTTGKLRQEGSLFTHTTYHLISGDKYVWEQRHIQQGI